MSIRRRRIEAADIISPQEFAERRIELRRRLLPIKNRRRVEVGPYAAFYFENYDTMWLQVQEMLRIEKGGEAQIAGELDAYNPLIPQGRELVATLMIEIDDPVRRNATLLRLAGIEDCVFLDADGGRIKAEPTEHEARTTPGGKTSSVHWVRFRFNPDEIAFFRSGMGRILLEIAHPEYAHMAVLPAETRAELSQDFEGD